MNQAAAEVPPQREVVETPHIRDVVERGLTYLRAGFALHLRGSAGVGKTTIAYHLARILGRPIVFMQGDDQLTTTDLVRGGLRVSRSRVVDNYIRSVVRTADDYQETWTDGWLASACKNGYTLIYDEFTRSRPETNNVLLSVLEERVLAAPATRSDLLPVHASFRAIFTSNPAEYAGVYRAADALHDRLVTIALERPDAATQAAILHARSGLDAPACERLVVLSEAVRRAAAAGGRDSPGLRASVALARVLQSTGLPPDFAHPAVAAFCHDLLGQGLDPDTLSGVLRAAAGEHAGEEATDETAGSGRRTS